MVRVLGKANLLLAPTRCGDTELRWGERTYVMGILNLSPDSFSGDGWSDDAEAAVVHTKWLLWMGCEPLNVSLFCALEPH